MDRLAAALSDRYRIERELGQGGMATVYLAHDLKHDRRVAIKVLKPELGAVLGAERFLSEIKVTANLQHPNLLPLFDSGDASGTLYYVMPLVEGESLRTRLDREKQLPIDEAVRIAVAVASALAYAHERGVIHRDLKPENILLQADQPVVADFGIALAVSNAGGTRVTQTGLSLGTPQYMSPEQATGDRAIDARSDIYSLAAVTYEMIAGEPPHTGPTAQAIMAKLMTAEPQPLSKLRHSAPVHVEATLARALAKLPADRFATAKEFAEALSGVRPVAMLAGGAGKGGAGSAASRGGRIRRAAEAVLTVVAVAGIAGTIYFGTRKAPAPGLTKFIAALPDSVQIPVQLAPTMALSPDGRELVISGKPQGLGSDDQRLYLRRMDDPAMVEIQGTKGASDPTFSPDGQWLLFRRDSDLVKVPVAGGTAVRVVSIGGPWGASWGDDGRVAYVGGTNDSDLWIVSSDGGGARQVTKGVRFIEPDVLPGGRFVLGVIRKSPLDSSELVLASAANGAVTHLGVRGLEPHYVSPGQIVFSRSDGTVLAVSFSLARRAITGAPVPIVEGVRARGPFPGFAVSRGSAVLAYVRASSAGQQFAMYAVTPTGKEQRLAPAPENFRGPRLSPDARHVVVRIGPPANGGDLWVYELATGARVRLTTNNQSRRPEWMPGGKRIAFLSFRDSATYESLVSRPWDLSRGETLLVARAPNHGGDLQELSMGPAHTWAAIRVGDRSRAQGADIWIAPTDSLAVMRPLLTGTAWEMEPRVSHDGRMLAYTSNESGDDEVYVTPLPGPGPHVAVSVDGGGQPVWSRDDKALYYRGSGHVMMASIAEGSPPRVTRRDTLFADDKYQSYSGFPSYDVFPDGRLLMIRSPASTDEGTTSAVVVLNWQRMLGKKGAAP